MMLITLSQSSTGTSDFFIEFLYDVDFADFADFGRWRYFMIVQCGVLLNSQEILS